MFQPYQALREMLNDRGYSDEDLDHHIEHQPHIFLAAHAALNTHGLRFAADTFEAGLAYEEMDDERGR